MGHIKTLLIAAPVALGLAFSPVAHAQHHGGGGYHGGYHGGGGGGALAGALAGVGVAALLGGLIAASQPAPTYYAPPPGYYPAPGYYAPPGYWR